MKDKETIEKELRRIERRDGIIQPHAVVEAARPKHSVLHRHFTWDDDKAAQEYRLWQARQLVAVVLYERAPDDQQRSFTSVIIEHQTNGDVELTRAYISTETVLQNPELREQILGQAIDELMRWRHKYNYFLELRDIIKCIDRSQKRRELQLLEA